MSKNSELLFDLAAFLGPVFMGSGIGVLISPAFNSAMVNWNLLGVILVGSGIHFINQAFSRRK